MLPAPKGGSRPVQLDQRIQRQILSASMLPAPKGGSRGRAGTRPSLAAGRFNAARPEGRESAAQDRPGRLTFGPASMLPAPKGGSRPAHHANSQGDVRRFNAARPEGRESGSCRV